MKLTKRNNMEIKKHNCKKHLEIYREEAGSLLVRGGGNSMRDVVGIRYKCSICGKRYGKVVYQEHPYHYSTFFI